MSLFSDGEDSMARILCVLLAIIAYLVITKWWELLLERLRPFEVSDVKCCELSPHFHDLYRRGLDGTEMVITAEGARGTLTLRKELIGPEGIRLYLILPEESPGRDGGDFSHARKALGAVLTRHGGERNLGLWGPWTKAVGNVAYCGESAEEAAAVAADVFRHVYGLADGAECRIIVRGKMFLWDRLVTNATMPSVREWPMIVRGAYAVGRPYKRSHQPLKYTLFGVVGLRLGVTWLRRMMQRILGRHR
jgi:hypothetical protein